MISPDRTGYRKTIPRSRENIGPTNNQPDTLEVATVVLKELSIGTTGAAGPKNGDVVIGKIRTSKWSDPCVVDSLVPVVKLPLTPPFGISRGGGRVYGGGTSDEALSRARKKSRLPKTR